MNLNPRSEYAQRLRQLARATYDAAGIPRGQPHANNSDPRMQLTQDAVDRILQDSREEGFSFLDREALDEWLRDHDVEAGCGNGRTLLLWAAARRRYDAIRELLARGADPTLDHRFELQDPRNVTNRVKITQHEGAAKFDFSHRKWESWNTLWTTHTG